MKLKTKPEKSPFVHIQLDAETYQKLKALAEADQRKVTPFTRILIKRQLDAITA